MKKIIRNICIVLAVILVVCSTATVMTVRSNFPDYKRNVELSKEQLNGKVEVIRDKWGVPQIYAKDNESLFFAQGYVQAQDRLWQMDINRVTGYGKLGEYFGKGFVELDYYMRAIGLAKSAKESYQLLDEETKKNLDAYVRGVNAFIEKNKKHLQMEYTVFRMTPQEWTPEDVLVTINIMVMYMSYNYLMEIMRAKIIATKGEDTVNKLFLYDSKEKIQVPDEVDHYKWLADNKISLDYAELCDSFSQKWGSNNWVISGKHTKSGKPILCNDTHISLSMPSMWYEMGLHSPSYNVSGYSLIGVPYVVIGHNERISWGITNVSADVQDLYIEKLDDTENPAKYYFKDKWEELKIEKEQIKVKGGKTVEKNIYYTIHGPIVNEAMEIGEQPMSMKWTLYEGNTMLNSINKINQAGNFTEFRDGLREWNNAAQNFIYADVDGNIGYQNTAYCPIRANKNQGLVPVPGWTGTYEWEGYVPFDELPSIYNPTEGYIATANNDTTDQYYPYYLSKDWSADYRVDRIKKMLSECENATIEDMKKIQLDAYSTPAEKLVPYFVSLKTDDRLKQEALEILKKWDYQEGKESSGAAIFEVWYNKLLQLIINDKFHYVTNTDYQPADRFIDYSDLHYPFITHLMEKEGSLWFDLEETQEKETKNDLLEQSLSEALKELSVKKESDLAKLEWGDVHKTILRDSALGSTGIGILDKIFNSDAYKSDGGNVTINVAGYNWDGSFMVNFGASQRVIIDLNDFDSSLCINSTGVTQQIFSKYREDQTKMWVEGKYKSYLFSEDAIKENKKYQYSIGSK